MRTDDKLVWTVTFEDVEEMKRVYEQLISVPHKRRKKELKELIDQLHSWIEGVGGWDE